MKKSKMNYAIIALVVVLLAIAIGYAAFSATLTVNGTATGTGTWDVHFKSAALKDSSGNTDEKHGSVVITDAKTVTATVNLAYPGDAVVLEVVVENSGNIPAKLTSFDINGVTLEDPDLEVTQAESGPTEDETLAANGGTCAAQFLVKWKTTSTASSLSKTFTITYQYDQDTTEVTYTPKHNDVQPSGQQ